MPLMGEPGGPTLQRPEASPGGTGWGAARLRPLGPADLLVKGWSLVHKGDGSGAAGGGVISDLCFQFVPCL